jgi:L-lactate dehydrogenase complex protein LldF
MNHCPVYTRIGGHAYGSTYPGPIGQVVMPQLKGQERAGDLLDACSLNGACGEVCPVGIDLPGLIRTLRQEREGRLAPWHQRLTWQLWRKVQLHPSLYRLSKRILRTLKPFRWIDPSGWSVHRAFPEPAPKSLSEHMRARRKARSPNHDA